MIQEQKVTIALPPWVNRIINRFYEQGFQCFVVGGAVRDALLQRPVLDYDLATDATPTQIQKIWRRTLLTGIAYGTVTVLAGKEHAEVTTFRKEQHYYDNRHPQEIQFGNNINIDLSRRDFTINAIAYNPITRELIDPYNGRDDIAAKIIRTVGNAADRFQEDALRILRAVRFATVLAFDIESETECGLRQYVDTICNISQERIREELNRIIQSSHCLQGFVLLARFALLRLIFRIDPLSTYLLHSDGITLNADSKRYIALTSLIAPNPTYLRHVLIWYGVLAASSLHHTPSIVCQKIKEQLSILRYARHHINAIIHLLSMLLRLPPANSTHADMRYFFFMVGSTHRTDIIHLLNAIFTIRHYDQKDLLIHIAAQQKIFSYTDLAINGYDLQKIGYKGKAIGAFKAEAIRYICRYPEKNTHHALLLRARSSLSFHM